MLEILENKKVLSLIERINRAENLGSTAEVVQNGKKTTRRSYYYPQGSVLVSGYTTEGNTIFLTYTSKEEFDEQFIKKDKSQMNGCIVARIHSGVEYMLFMELQTPGKPGEWIIQGKDKFKNIVDKRFTTQEELLLGRGEAYKKIEERAVVHHVGTNVYQIVEVEKFRTQ